MLKALTTALAAVVLSLGMNTAGAETDDAKQAELDQLAENYNQRVEDDRDEVVCEWVSETGTRIKEKRCRTKWQKKYDADEANRFAKKPKQSYKSE